MPMAMTEKAANSDEGSLSLSGDFGFSVAGDVCFPASSTRVGSIEFGQLYEA